MRQRNDGAIGRLGSKYYSSIPTPPKQFKITVLTLYAMVMTLCPSADAQQAKRIPRIGYLATNDPISDSSRSQALLLALRELGYREGENTALEYRYAEGRIDRLPSLAVDLVRLNVDVIVAAGGRPVIQAPMNATKTIPIVMAGRGPDRVETGFVESLARPGGNVTGMTNLLVQLGDKRLELFKEAVPKLSRIAVPYVPGNQTHLLELKEVQTAAREMRMTVQTWEVYDAEYFDKIFSAMRKQLPDAIQVLGGPIMRDNDKRIVDFATKSRLPSVFATRESVNIGGLMYYGADDADTYRKIALFIDKILRGAKPAELPVEQPTKFELLINLKTAQQIGLTIPPHVLARANKVIK